MDEIDRMRIASGSVKSKDPLVCFLYLLLRQGLPFGEIEDLIDQSIAATNSEKMIGESFFVFTNGWAARHAEDMANRLNPNSE